MPQIRLSNPVQLGIAVKNIEHTATLLAALLGIENWRFEDWDASAKGAAQSFYRGMPSPEWRARLAFATLGNIDIELIEHVQGQSGYQDFMNKKGEGLRHLMFVTEQVDTVIHFAQSLNIGVSTEVKGSPPDRKWAILDTTDLLGFDIELVSPQGIR